jgi:methyl-accepting chemotaxis protein
MRHLSIKHVITSVIGVLILAILAVGGFGYYTTQAAVDSLEKAVLRDARQQTMINNLMLRMETNRSQLLQALQHNPDASYAKMHDHPVNVHFKQIEDNTRALVEARDAFNASLRTPEAKALVAAWYAQSHDLGVAYVSAAAKAIDANQWDEAERILIKEVNPTYKQAQPAYDALLGFLDKRARTTAEQTTADSKTRAILMGVVVAVGCALGISAGIFLLRTILQPLGEAVSLARRVAQGDLSADIRTDARNEFGQLLTALGEMNTSLAKIVGEVRTGTETMASASSEISAGNLELSSRTEEQAGTLEETAASVEELTSTVRQNADNAKQANVLAVAASATATRGGAVVAEVVQTMGAINASAKKIVDIISVIDGIAFQTNILALNAAVEAARAGEQGRGFAVVAGEVRTLAHRSAEAAKEIKDLINDSVDKVASGSALVDQAGTTMHDVVDGIRRVADIVGEITAASQEQSIGIEQIHHALTQMDQVTQQNAAMVEEATGASQQLQNRAAGLAELVSVFRLGTAPASPARRGAQPASPARRPQMMVDWQEA